MKCKKCSKKIKSLIAGELYCPDCFIDKNKKKFNELPT